MKKKYKKYPFTISRAWWQITFLAMEKFVPFFLLFCWFFSIFNVKLRIIYFNAVVCSRMKKKFLIKFTRLPKSNLTKRI